MPTASASCLGSEGSTLKESAMHWMATSTESLSSAGRVPSDTEEERNSQIATARRCFVVEACGGGRRG